MEIWLKIEFAPWFTGFSSPPDEDGDGFPEIYGRVAADAIGPTAAIVKFIRTEYEGRVLTPAEVKAWAGIPVHHRLAGVVWLGHRREGAADAEVGRRRRPVPTRVVGAP